MRGERKPRCAFCGKFMSIKPGDFWKVCYSGAIPEPDDEIYAHKGCGPFAADPRIKPEGSIQMLKSEGGLK